MTTPLLKWQPVKPRNDAPLQIVSSFSQNQRLKVGEWLIAKGWLTQDQLAVALKEQSRRTERLGELMAGLSFISPLQLVTALSALSGLPFIILEQQILDQPVVQALPHDIAHRHNLILFKKSQDPDGREEYHLAMADPEDILALDAVREFMASRHKLQPFLRAYHTTLKGIAHALEVYYPHPAVTRQSGRQEGEIIRFVNDIILKAVRLSASDIHLSPTTHGIQIHYRQDGLLQVAHTLHKDQWPALCVRLKIMAALDIAESRRPQNGRFSLTLAGRDIDFRLSCHPTIHGENLVIRILDKTHSLRSLDELGFRKEDIDLVKRLVQLPQGMIILSGPTGSGKTTTLYALLAHMDAQSRNIMTLEEPVEYYLPHIRQTEIREGGPFRFAEGVRSLLRQDPDVILISEIRDAETAQMALRAAMTGHLVLGTIHARDSLAIPQRFDDLGVSPSLLKGHLTAGIAQRLIRLLCQACRQPHHPSPEEQALFPLDSRKADIFKAKGCPECGQTGYKGRKAVAGLTLFNSDMSLNPGEGQTVYADRDTLWDRGIEKVLGGQTTLAEISRIIGEPF